MRHQIDIFIIHILLGHSCYAAFIWTHNFKKKNILVFIKLLRNNLRAYVCKKVSLTFIIRLWSDVIIYTKTKKLNRMLKWELACMRVLMLIFKIFLIVNVDIFNHILSFLIISEWFLEFYQTGFNFFKVKQKSKHTYKS